MSSNSSITSNSARLRAVKVIIVSSVMFTFISYWRTAAVVLCDLASTAFYIGGIAESSVGPAAPWFIFAVMLFSGAVCVVYIESCSLFVRGGVYRVVRAALGSFFGKLAVSALMFDFILTGPISGVAAGQYVMGLGIQLIKLTMPTVFEDIGLSDDGYRRAVGNSGSVIIACLVTIYFFRQNLLGIHESSDKALKIVIATTIMAVIVLGWCGVTLYVDGARNSVPMAPDLNKKVEYEETIATDPDTGQERSVWLKDPTTGKLVPKIDARTGKPILKESEALKKLGIEGEQDPLGFLGRLLPENMQNSLRDPTSWLSLLGLVGLIIAFGHSILAMSGEETLAQVYREVESPKLPNFKKAALIVFVFSLVVTTGISFMAVLLIPDEIRMKDYSENLIGGLARNVIGPPLVKLLLEGFVVVVGFLILSGAVNTAIIGSNGVLNRVAEDGVLPAWFQKPHSRYGTTYRLLFLILILELITILLSGGDMIVLGEAYAFGVVWSFVFISLAMVVLRFKDRTPREFKVPFNLKIRGVELPLGLIFVFLTLLAAAIMNFLTKEVATVGGLLFTSLFLLVFTLSERSHVNRRKGKAHTHLEQFNQEQTQLITSETLHLTKQFRKLVAIRSTQNLFMLETALAETDPETTDVVVMTAKVEQRGGEGENSFVDLDNYDQALMTAVVQRRKAGKQVHPLIVVTNNPLHSILQTARDLQAQEVVVGGSNKFLADEQMEQIGFFWITLNAGETKPLTVRILSRDRDVYFDLGGGNRIPKITERRARSVEELRAGGVGVDRVLLVHEGTMADNDLFQAVLTMLDPQVLLAVVPVKEAPELLAKIREQSERLDRYVNMLTLKGDAGPALVKLAKEDHYDLIILSWPLEAAEGQANRLPKWADHVIKYAHCRVFLAAAANVPKEVAE